MTQRLDIEAGTRLWRQSSALGGAPSTKAPFFSVSAEAFLESPSVHGGRLACSLLNGRSRACRRMGFELQGCPSDISPQCHGSGSSGAPPFTDDANRRCKRHRSANVLRRSSSPLDRNKGRLSCALRRACTASIRQRPVRPVECPHVRRARSA